MHISDRKTFDLLLKDLSKATTVVFDTETNGLQVFKGHRPFSMSFYFPEFDTSYNFSWGAGQSDLEIPQDYKSPFEKLTWQTNQKKQIYKDYWWRKYRVSGEIDFCNMPAAWVEEIKALWGRDGVTYVAYNLPFDIHMTEALGFPTPKLAEDVRIAVDLVYEDWNYLGHEGNNSLKWQAKYFGVEGAVDGDEALSEGLSQLAAHFAQFILDNWDDPINTHYWPAKKVKNKETGETVEVANMKKPDLAHLAKRVAFNGKSEMHLLPADLSAFYAETDTRITWGLREKLREVLDQWHQWPLYMEQNDIQLNVLIRMERNGILLDKDMAREQMKVLEPIMAEENEWFFSRIIGWVGAQRERLDKAQREGDGVQEKLATLQLKSLEEAFADKKGNYSFTVGSHEKLKAFLEKIGVDVESTEAAVLDRWVENNGPNEAIDRILNYRTAQKGYSTYLSKWVRSADANGFVHPSFNITGTVTGRLSSSSGTLGEMGNMQNIPTRGFTVKKALITPPDWLMFQIDYAQIELRMAAMVANCQPMIRMFNSGEDLHGYTAKSLNVRQHLFGDKDDWEILAILRETAKDAKEAAEKVWKYVRHVGKTCNFSLLYGGTFRVLVRELKIEAELAERLHQGWHSLYPEFAAANAEFERLGMTRRPRPDGTGSVLYVQQPISGRTRKFGFYPTVETIYDPKKKKSWKQRTAERKAKDGFNAAIQGQCSQIMTASAARVCNKYPNDILRPFALVHDSFNGYVHRDHIHILADVVEIMGDWYEAIAQHIGANQYVPLEAELEVSSDGSWQSLKKVLDFDLLVSSRGYEGIA